MKQYKKYQVIAKNLPTGSYAAGCPEKDRDWGGTHGHCMDCERTS